MLELWIYLLFVLPELLLEDEEGPPPESKAGVMIIDGG